MVERGSCHWLYEAQRKGMGLKSILRNDKNINASFTYCSNFLFLAYDCRSDIVAECPTLSFLFFLLRMIPSGPKICL